MLWNEPKAPDFVMEITSRRTRSQDQGPKRGTYAFLGVQEYVQYDPTSDYLRPPLRGLSLVGDNYELMPTTVSPDGTLTLYSNVFTVVPLYYLAFKLGQFVLADERSKMPAFTLGTEGKSFSEWASTLFHWLASLGKPVLVGLPLLASIFAVVGYLAVWWGWRLYTVIAWRARQRRRDKETPAP